MSGFIDMHHHIAWGMDDGPAAFKSAVRMMHAASEDGIRYIIATPHVQPGIVEFDYEGFLHKLNVLNKYSMERNLYIAVYPGAEIMYTDRTAQLLSKRQIPSLADSEFVLVEFQPEVEYDTVFKAVRSLTNDGFVPVIAHVERYTCMLQRHDLLEELKEMFHIRVQMNCSTILNGRGRQLRKFVKMCLKEKLVDYVATDAHNTHSRSTCMYDCYEKLVDGYGPHYAAMVTGANQEEIIVNKLVAVQR